MRTVIALLFLASAAWNTAAACTCVGRRPFCEVPPTSAQSVDELVFLGTVERADPISGFGKNRLIAIRVDETFVGSPGPVFEFRGGSGSCCDCSLPFAVGERYLISAHRWQGRWIADTCGGSASLQSRRAQLDLRALRGWKYGTPPVRSIDGVVNDRTRRRIPGFLPPPAPPGLRVQLSGSGVQRSASTDADGKFSFDNLPAGRFRLQLSAPGWFAFGSSDALAQEVDLTAQSCGYPNFALRQLQSTARGRIRRQDGKPPRWILVEALPVQPTHASYRPSSARTNEQGEFEIADLEPGEYIFGIHVGAEPPGILPVSYYPGFQDRDRAQRFVLVRGQNLELALWFLPADR